MDCSFDDENKELCKQQPFLIQIGCIKADPLKKLKEKNVRTHLIYCKINNFLPS